MERLKKEEVISVFTEILQNSHYRRVQRFINIEFSFKNCNDAVQLIFINGKFLKKRPFDAKSALSITIRFKVNKILIIGSGDFEKMRADLTFNELIMGERIAKLAEILY